MLNKIYTLIVASCMMASCTVGPSITRTPKGGYHASGGNSFIANQKVASATIETAEGDKITFTGLEQDSDEAVNTGISVAGAYGAVKQYYGAAKHKVATDAGLSKHKSDNQLKTFSRKLDSHDAANSINGGLEIPAKHPE